MAIYHLSIKPISRGGGRSATAASAYRAAELVHDHTTGETFDYTRKQGVDYTEIVLPTEAVKQDINWARDRSALWNAAEQAENRSNSRVAREYEVALPHEMSPGQRVELVRAFSQGLADRYGVAVDIAIHAPHRHGDERNHHAHLMTTTRKIEAAGLGAKTEIEWSDGNRRKAGLGPAKEEISLIRGQWAEITNQRLKELSLEIRIDHRSLRTQGLEREPTSHLGPAVSGMERRGIETEVGKRIAWEMEAATTRRLQQAAELGQVEREAAELQKSILDLSGDLKAAKQARQGLAVEHEHALEISAPKRDKFAGLKLGVKGPAAERGVFADLRLPVSTPALESAAQAAKRQLNLAVDRYASAWMDATRMRAQQLPILEHQHVELKAASQQLERAQPGAQRDLGLALEHQAETRQAMIALQGPERVQKLVAGIDYEAQVRVDPELKAQRWVKTWHGLQARHKELGGWEHTEARGKVEEQIKTLAHELKSDPQFESHLRARQQALGIEQGSRLERVMKEQHIERAVSMSIGERGRHLGLSL